MFELLWERNSARWQDRNLRGCAEVDNLKWFECRPNGMWFTLWLAGFLGVHVFDFQPSCSGFAFDKRVSKNDEIANIWRFTESQYFYRPKIDFFLPYRSANTNLYGTLFISWCRTLDFEPPVLQSFPPMKNTNNLNNQSFEGCDFWSLGFEWLTDRENDDDSC